jgi:hypothetical protein
MVAKLPPMPLRGEDGKIGLRVAPGAVVMSGRACQQEGHEVHAAVVA